MAEFRCIACGHTEMADDKLIGHSAKCPKCGFMWAITRIAVEANAVSLADEIDLPPAIPAAPPLQGPHRSESRPIWPIIVGVISTLYSLCLFEIVYFDLDRAQRIAKANSDLASILETFAVLRSIGALLLLSGGILILCRVRFGRLLHILFAITEMILTIGFILVCQSLSTAAGTSGGSQNAVDISPLFLRMIYPAVVLSFFLAPSIDKDMRKWKGVPSTRKNT